MKMFKLTDSKGEIIVGNDGHENGDLGFSGLMTKVAEVQACDWLGRRP
jgi:hypothetical protein